MLRRIIIIFLRDFKVNTRDFIALYILLVPLIFGIGINLLAPSVNDTTVEIAVVENENQELVAYFNQFAKVEELADANAVEERVNGRDDIVGILPEGDHYVIVAQGNEPEAVVEFAKIVKTYYDTDVSIEETNVALHSFGNEVPPLKPMLVNILLLMISVLGGMLIALNIVEEKMDNTVSAINVTPTGRKTFILGKSLMGVLLAVYGSFTLLLVTGYGNINMLQVVISIFACSVITIVIGFIQGINNDDVMSAVGSVKILFLPVAGVVAAIELLGEKWQMLFYWIPFYWTYKGNAAVLSEQATWTQILSYTLIVLVIAGLIFAVLAPRIRKGLE